MNIDMQLNQEIQKISTALINYIQASRDIIIRKINFKFIEQETTRILYYTGVEGDFYY